MLAKTINAKTQRRKDARKQSGDQASHNPLRPGYVLLGIPSSLLLCVFASLRCLFGIQVAGCFSPTCVNANALRGGGRSRVGVLLCLLTALALVLPSNVEAQVLRSNQPREVVPAVPAVERELPAPIGGINVDQMLSPEGLTPTLKLMILMTLLSLAPSILMMTTSFIRFMIVFGLLRQALGTQQLPPNQVITALSLFLTLFLMQPVWQESYTEGIAPYVNNQPIPHLQKGEDPLQRVFLNTFRPVQRFMSQQIHKAGGEDIVFMLIDYRRPDPNTSEGRRYQMPESFDDVEPSIIVTAFMLSELKTAFVIGFQIFLPFVVIDLVVSILLTSMGMMMLPPTLISLPFKLLLFVLIDGWTLTVQMLLRSVDPSFG